MLLTKTKAIRRNFGICLDREKTLRKPGVSSYPRWIQNRTMTAFEVSQKEILIKNWGIK